MPLFSRSRSRSSSSGSNGQQLSSATAAAATANGVGKAAAAAAAASPADGNLKQRGRHEEPFGSPAEVGKGVAGAGADEAGTPSTLTPSGDDETPGEANGFRFRRRSPAACLPPPNTTAVGACEPNHAVLYALCFLQAVRCCSLAPPHHGRFSKALFCSLSLTHPLAHADCCLSSPTPLNTLPVSPSSQS